MGVIYRFNFERLRRPFILNSCKHMQKMGALLKYTKQQILCKMAAANENTMSFLQL